MQPMIALFSTDELMKSSTYITEAYLLSGDSREHAENVVSGFRLGQCDVASEGPDALPVFARSLATAAYAAALLGHYAEGLRLLLDVRPS